MTTTPNEPSATGPKTQDGKAASSRNATSHGLFSRDVVLTHLGEDPEGYSQVLRELADQIKPHNLLEQHYVEVIAAASWRLRRLQRWQANIYVAPRMSDNDRLDQLDRVMRHETMLLRQIDKAVRLLAKDTPQLFESRARAEALGELHLTEANCQSDLAIETQVALRSRELLPKAPVPEAFDAETLDRIAPEPTEKCQNEPPPAPARLLPPDTVDQDGWPVYVTEEDKAIMRDYVADEEINEAQCHLDDCRSEYEAAYRKQELTTAEILAQLNLGCHQHDKENEEEEEEEVQEKVTVAPVVPLAVPTNQGLARQVPTGHGPVPRSFSNGLWPF